jgi:arsenate reductase
MERKFDEELNELKKKILEMTSLVNDIIEKAVRALIEKNEELANQVEKTDEEVDNFENEIDQFCLELLARYQPAAIDLRFITSIMKINNDVERIGDLATTIAHKAKIIMKHQPVEIPQNIIKIHNDIKEMLKDVINSLIEKNENKAKEICQRDKKIDELYVETFRQILDLIINGNLNVKAGIELILTIKYLERIADHITNIAEDVVYLVSGESIKHKKELNKERVLFVCVHNSARSQMAEAYLNHFAGDRFFAESAGIEPGILNPYVIKVMKEDGIDISRNKTKSVFDFYKQGKLYSYVITVCEQEAAEKCPIFPGGGKRLHWSFPDPSKFTGSEEEILDKVRKVRDEIKEKIKEFINKGIL